MFYISLPLSAFSELPFPSLCPPAAPPASCTSLPVPPAPSRGLRSLRSAKRSHCISSPRPSSGYLFVAILDLRKTPGRKQNSLANNRKCDCNRSHDLHYFSEMGQGSSKERYKSAVKKLSSIELANIEAVFNEVSTKREDGSRHVELSLINRQDFAERFRLPGFIAERLFLAFDRTEVPYTLGTFWWRNLYLISLSVETAT